MMETSVSQLKNFREIINDELWEMGSFYANNGKQLNFTIQSICYFAI